MRNPVFLSYVTTIRRINGYIEGKGIGMTKREAGRLGGLQTARVHGREYMRAIGKKGAHTTWERYTLKPVGICGWAMIERMTGKVKALIDYTGFLPNGQSHNTERLGTI